MNLDSYRTWLEGRKYRPATIAASVRGIEALERQYVAGVPMATIVQNFHAYHFVRRYSAWLTQAGVAPGSAFDRDALLFAPDGVPLAPRHDRSRKRPAVSVRPGDWPKLVAALAADESVEGRALYAMACSGLRIGDLLGLRQQALLEGIESGTLVLETKGGHVRELPIADADGAPTTDAWERLRAVWLDGASLAELVCPAGAHGARAGAGAYMRLHRHLKAACAELGISGRAYSHRLRRTVAVRALRATKDSRLVQSLLGHKSSSSTEYYIDELRQDELAELQQRLNAGAGAGGAGGAARAARAARKPLETPVERRAPPEAAGRRRAPRHARAAAAVLHAPRCPYCGALQPLQDIGAPLPKSCRDCGRSIMTASWK